MRSAAIGIGIGLAMLAWQPLFAEHAEHRGGGSGGSTHSEGHHEHSAPPRASGDSGGGVHSGNTSSGHTTTDAERRHPQAGTGERHYYHNGHYYRPIFRDSVFFGYGCIDCGYYDVWYPWYYPRYHYRYYDESPAVRIQVEPDKARVYVDGYYAGIVDDFDGLFQRLYVSPGRHEIALKLEGYRTHRFTIYGTPGHTTKIHFNMVHGEGEDQPETMADVPPPDASHDADRDGDPDRPAPAPYVDDRPADRHEMGTLSLDVRPRDAAVYIDGQAYPQAVNDDIQLPAGTHHVEVVRPGYLSFEKDVEVRPGKTADLDVRLDKK